MTRLTCGGWMMAMGVLMAGWWIPASAQAPSEQVDAYVLLVRAEQALRNEDREGAIAAFQGALTLYQDLVGKDSDNQRLIEYRIAYCRNQLEQLGATETSPQQDPPAAVVESIPLPVPAVEMESVSAVEPDPAPVSEVEPVVEVETPAIEGGRDREELLAHVALLEAMVADLQASLETQVARDELDRAVAAAREECHAWRSEAEAERQRLNDERLLFRNQVDALQAERAEWVAQRAEWAAMFAEWEGIEDELLVVVRERDALKAERDALAVDLAAAGTALTSAREEAVHQFQQEAEARVAAVIAERDQALSAAAQSQADQERREFLEKQVSMLHSELDLFRNRLVASEQRVRELTRQVLLKAD